MDAPALSDEVLSLLELRESAQVPVWTAQRLGSLLEASDARILQVFPIEAARRKKAGDVRFAVSTGGQAAPVPVEPGSDLARAIEAGQPVRAAHDLYFPLAALGEVRYAVHLPGVRAARADGMADCLLPLIGAYFARLVDAETDPLTHLANRRVFYSAVSSGLQRWARSEQQWFIAVADIDHFKQVNDRYGHLYGDEILIQFARLMRRSFRAGDLLFRFGGEEFVVVFGVRSGETGSVPLERFRRAVMSHAFPNVGRITVSIGVSSVTDASVPATTLVDRADRALYCAKALGRNRTCSYEALVAAGEIRPDKPPQSEATLF